MTQYGYDEVGNRISQTDANQHTTKYVYDQLGRRISRTLPAGQSESYSYDAVGNLQQKIDFNGKTTTYAYDSNNRLQSKTPDPSFSAPAVGFTYSATGKRLTMSDVSGVTTYTYDPQTDRLMQKQTPEGTLNYTYDAAGNLKSLQSQNQNGASDAYTYDADNRLATVTDASGQTAYAYDNVGNLQSFAYPNGVTTAYTYDTLNRLTQMGAGKNGAQQANYVYTLGAAGNRLTVAELSGRMVNYGYDSLYRLTSEAITNDPNNHNNTTQYQYDNVGNRQQLIVNGTTANVYSYDSDDRLGSDQYDANGNTTGSAGTTNVYDFENHLVQHGTQPGAVTIVYDGDGNRVSETVAGVTTKYLVDTQNPTGYAQVVDELQNGAVTRTYSWGLELISKLETGNSKRSFYGFDGHGSVRFLTDSTGAVTDTYDYDAFGNLINSIGSTPNNYLFVGEQYDPALGLYYNRARYLNTTTGRFWSMDTEEGDDESPLSLHKYLYAGINPVNRVDPSGHDSIAELTESEAVDEILSTMSQIQKTIDIKNRITSVFDLLAAVKDISIDLSTGGPLSDAFENALGDLVGQLASRYSAKQFGFDLAESLERNAGKIAEEVAAHRLSDVSKFLTSKAPIAVFLPTPFALPSVTLEMPFTLVGRPVETVFGGGGGGRLLGFGTDFSGDLNMFFRIDLTFDLKQLFERHPPTGSGSDLTPGRDDYAAWNDNSYFHYHVPKH